jgi:type I restriction enzyme S subunit
MANNNNTKNLNVPNLRFPEFKGEWEKIIIDDLGDIVTGTTPPTNNHSNYGNEYLWASPADLGGVKYITDTKTKLSQLGFDRTRKIAKNSILVTCIGSTIGKMGMASTNMCTNQQINSIIVNKNYDDNFVYYAINSRFPKYLSSVAMQAVPIISKSAFEKLENYTPKYEEQKKIGLFLSLIDQRIENQSKIIEKYESLIKGIGNKLFSLKMRFKTNDGNDFPSWKTKSFENIGKTFSGLSGKAKEDFGIGKPYIQYKQVFDSPQIQIQNCGLVNVSDSENQNNVKYGDVFFTVSSETPDEIGMSSVLLDEVDEMYLNSFCFGYRLSSFEVLSPLYASYFFRDSSFRNKVVKIAQGSTRYNISKSELIKLEISLPSIEEQARIASFLSAVDEKIKNEKEILNLYLIQKSYLLRQMFI